MAFIRAAINILIIFVLLGAAGAQEQQQQVPAGLLVSAVDDYILAHVNVPRDELVIERKQPLANEAVPAGDVEIKVTTPVNTKFFGLTPAEVQIYVGGKLYKQFITYVTIDMKTRACMAKEWINRDMILTSDTVEEVDTYRSKVPHDAVTDIRQCFGKAAKVAIPKGKFIGSSLIDMPYIIKKDDLVDVIIERGSLKIIAKARALGSAKKDETVRLRVLDSKREIYGKVIDEKTVAAETGN